MTAFKRASRTPSQGVTWVDYEAILPLSNLQVWLQKWINVRTHSAAKKYLDDDVDPKEVFCLKGTFQSVA